MPLLVVPDTIEMFTDLTFDFTWVESPSECWHVVTAELLQSIIITNNIIMLHSPLFVLITQDVGPYAFK